jgi:hypothetical protein
MITISDEYEYNKQIDRACAAQSAELMPKPITTPESVKAEKAAMKAKIEARFNKGK